MSVPPVETPNSEIGTAAPLTGRRWALLPAVLVLAATACGPKTEIVDPANDSGQAQTADQPDATPGEGAIGDAGVADDGWRFSSGHDAMTDEQSSTAVRSYGSGPFMIEVSIVCSPQSMPAYRFAAFQDGAAASFVWETRVHPYFGPSSVAEYQVRLDNAAAQPLDSREHRYSNVITMGGDKEGIQSARWGRDAIQAHRAVFALRLEGGDAVVDIDQSQGPLGEFLDRCERTSPPQINMPGNTPPAAMPEVAPTPTTTPDASTEATDGAAPQNRAE